ncbi:MAG TPA: putative quinol monooxygenase [Chloroflexota bacterium]|jgi:quinol monooxygenase YgiN|nr:putative quinol monooxygenase [Chloroflexota bacterium]
MLTLMVKLSVKPEKVDEFLPLLEANGRAAVRDEPGCYRFDISRGKDNPSDIYLYEVYADEAALDAHRDAPHYIKWRDAVKDMYRADAERTLASTVVPTDAEWKAGKP